MPRHPRTARAHLAWIGGTFAAGCSLVVDASGLSGEESDASTPSDAGAVGEVRAEAAAGDALAQDGASACGAATPDAICSSFDEGAPDLGWLTRTNDGAFSIVASGFSPPNAVLFALPNQGPQESGAYFERAFGGRWSRHECEFVAALDEIPEIGAVDISTAGSDGASFDEVGLRVYKTELALISCRDGSDCRPEVAAGPVPPIGEYHRYRVVWDADGAFSASVDGAPRGAIGTKTPLDGQQRDLVVRFGLVFRPFGDGGTFRVRFDDVACRRTP